MFVECKAHRDLAPGLVARNWCKAAGTARNIAKLNGKRLIATEATPRNVAMVTVGNKPVKDSCGRILCARSANAKAV